MSGDSPSLPRPTWIGLRRTEPDAAAVGLGHRIRVDARSGDLPDLVLKLCRNATEIASIAEATLHQDARYRGVRLSPVPGPGTIAIHGYVTDQRLLPPLIRFAREWGGFSLRIELLPSRGPALNSAGR